MKLAICGTFDVRNFGDLLFPLIAQNELAKRLGPIDLQRYSYHSRSAPAWPFDVLPISRLARDIETIDGLIIGGGHIIRFDKNVAPNYLPPDPNIPHPTGYWLSPAVLAVNRGCPLVWNAPGVYGEVPEWAEGLMKLAFENSRYIAVRDEPSRDALAKFAGDTEIAVVPDTGFGIASLLNGEDPSADFARLRDKLHLKQPYIVIQSSSDLVDAVKLLKAGASRLNKIQIVSLPVGPVLGDDDAILSDILPDVLHLPEWPHPLVIAELIRDSAGVVCSSLHSTIVALAFGVPVFRPANTYNGKNAPLRKFKNIFEIPSGRVADNNWLFDRLGRVQPEPAVEAVTSTLDLHWTRMTHALSTRDSSQPAAAGRFLQSLAITLEAAQTQNAAIAAAAQAQASVESSLRQQLAASQATNTALLQSHSWKITAPMRWARSIFGMPSRRPARPILQVKRLADNSLFTKPYEWTAIDKLFVPADAKALAASYPCDKFKSVKGYDGEKSYEYEARALIHLGTASVAFLEGLSESWRRLASDLLSPSYRDAMSRLTGRDLSTAPMEAYVCHFGADAWLGPHLDLKDKVLTHVFYFNKEWDDADGGCLKILNSSKMDDEVATISPIVGNSSVIVRSDKSWHAVSKVVKNSPQSRRSMNVIFYRPGAKSTMWPEGDATPLHSYSGRL